MAEEDESQKTEDPTGKKLEKAREKGQAAVSQEIKNWAVMFVGTMILMGLAPLLMNRLRDISYKFIQAPHTVPMDTNHLRFVVSDVLGDVGLAMTPIFAVLFLAALVAGVAQVGLMWAPAKIAPELSKISVIKGLGRMFSAKTLVEFLKGILKLVIVGVVGFGLAVPMLKDIGMFPMYPIEAFLDRLYLVAILLAIGAMAVMSLIAILDYAYQKYTFIKGLKMSKQEVKDEHKQAEGDPLIKRKIHQLRVERARQRMMANVPDADVVITNPTHFAVALQYNIEEMMAPRLLAKGVDEVAFRIRSVAEDNDVPVVENPPLARALYAAVEIDEEIPAEHYKAVAEVIGYVMRLRGDMPKTVPVDEN